MANYRFTELDQPDNTATLTQRIYQTLRTEIVAGQLGPG